MTIFLKGEVPAKKSLYRRKKGGGLYLDEAVAAKIDALAWQARQQWGQRLPLEHPDMTFTFLVRDGRKDRDGLLATVMDLLQKARVIRQDNIAHCNGTIVLLPAQVGEVEGVSIKIAAWGPSR
jgi:Holliday junction resolvase RusA-like endonuclease